MEHSPGSRLYRWIETRTHVSPAIAHMKRKQVAQHRHTLWYYFGGFALFLLALQFVTGVLLLLRYSPSAAPAADPLTGKPLCMVRATDSVVAVIVTDTSLFEYNKGDEVAFPYAGIPDSGVPAYLRGKSKIEYVLPKDSLMIVPYSAVAVAGPPDSGGAATAPAVKEIPDVPKVLQDDVAIVRDTISGAIVHPSEAYVSVQRIMKDVPFGSVVRGMHAFGANLFVACVLLHMLSVFLMKGYRQPREVMWLSGVLLLAISLGFGFTGYLLPWTKLSYFATRVGVTYPESFIPGAGKFIANVLRGGNEVTGETLTRMFALHVAALPLVALLLVLIHLAVLQVHGTSSPVGARESGMNLAAACAGAVALGMLALYKATSASFDFTSAWFVLPAAVLPVVAGFYLGQALLGSGKRREGGRAPIAFFWNFAMRDYIGWAFGLILLIALALYAPWQSGGPSNAPVDITQPLVTPLGIHPDWYFMASYELLRIIPGEIAMILFAAGGAAWFFIPFLDKESKHEKKSPRFTLIGVAIIAAFLGLTWLGYNAASDELHQAQTHERAK